MPYKDPKNRPTYNKKEKIKKALLLIVDSKSAKRREYMKLYRAGVLKTRPYEIERMTRSPSKEKK